MRSAPILFTFIGVLALTVFATIVVWPGAPERYLPGDFWPNGRGIKIGTFEREEMRLGLDLRGGSYLVLEANPPDGYEGDLDEALGVARDVIERRVNAFGVSEAEITKVSGNRLSVQVPGMAIDDAQRLIGRTAQLEFRVVNEAGQEVPATGIIDGQVIAMTGQHLRNNTSPVQIGLDYAVQFETTGTGTRLMEQITSRALQYPRGSPQNLLLIYLDNENISRASVNSVISDSGIISGLGTFSNARDLSRQLNAGALPVPLRTIQASEVSATLGEDSVLDSVRAGEVGLLAVALFMILFYRLPGVLASGALLVYTVLVLMVFKLWPVTLTLSGIAAFVLSVGMAVDANVLIFERMKEELRKGRTLNTAIDLGFRRAWPSIRDSNVATFITCFILYWFGDQFGAAPVKGFALTLAIGVAVSMFSAITITRTFLKMVVGTPLARNGWLWNAEEVKRGATPAEVPEPGAPRTKSQFLQFSSKRWWYLSISGMAVLAALIILVIPPRLVPGIEFTSGSTFTLRFEQPVAQAELRTAMGDLGHPEARVQGAGPNTYLIRTNELEGAPPLEGPQQGPPPEGEIDQIQATLEERFGPLTRVDFATVSSSVSTEIARYATFAVIAAAAAILVYICVAFRNIPDSFRYGAAAVVALVHDALIILGLFSLLGKINGTEVDTAFLTALLTIIGFSVHDTIVTFDRMREHLERDPYVPFEEAVDASLTETLTRSINTSMVVVLTVVAMLLLGGPTIQNFLIVLLVGIISGTYSSIGVSSQLLVVWHNGDIPRFFRRITGRKPREEAPGPPSYEPAS